MKKYIRAGVMDVRDESWESKLGVAKNPNTRPSTLMNLINYYLDNPGMRNNLVLSCVAENLNTPEEGLRALCKLDQFSIDLGLSHNLNTPPDVLDRIYRRGRAIPDIIEHPNTAFQTLLNIYEEYLGWADIVDSVKAALFKRGYQL